MPLPHQIRNSNSHALAALVEESGGDAMRLPHAADSHEALEAAIEQARDCDLLLFSGGVSAGRHDLVENALAAEGAEFFFTGVRMQPGRPVVFGRIPARRPAAGAVLLRPARQYSLEGCHVPRLRAHASGGARRRRCAAAVFCRSNAERRCPEEIRVDAFSSGYPDAHAATAHGARHRDTRIGRPRGECALQLLRSAAA